MSTSLWHKNWPGNHPPFFTDVWVRLPNGQPAIAQIQTSGTFDQLDPFFRFAADGNFTCPWWTIASWKPV